MTTTSLTPEKHLTVVKHLANGKGLDVTATITKLDRSVVVDVGSKHGYPDRQKLAWAADILAKKIDQGQALVEDPNRDARARAGSPVTLPTRPTPTPAPAPAPGGLTKPDEIRILINTAKAHPAKRIQTAADRLLDQVGRLRDLIAEDQEKNAEKRRIAAEKDAARAEVKRLEQQLADAKAKLKGKSPHQQPGGRAAVASGQIKRAQALGQSALLSNADLEPLGLDSKKLRAWATEHDVEVPAAGRLPRRILDAWQADQQQSSEAAS